MFDLEKYGSKLFAAAFSLTLSAAFFAAAIVPASPNGVLA
ncbi:recombination protein F [Qipengyuania gelatinilytica]|uniref:Recombination protein F n=1 Tax=Qipengyuania gelatinilytica TaxID=2867231 RepID=A0ABX9A0V9_9SPHN|nr:recombination protein F [Qipengyuania gelatinilytica]QZD94907.1 recombination protein F [Qipengyuania gelatinilytica]